MKLTEKELNEFPIGTKIIIAEKEKEFIKSSLDKDDNDWYCDKPIGLKNWFNERDLLELGINKVEIPTYTEYIPLKPILDDKEKEYLSAVVMPYKKKIKYIAKEKLCCSNGKSKEYIAISFPNVIDSFDLPLFKPNVMYKGMELDKEYSLEELRLIVDENIQM